MIRDLDLIREILLKLELDKTGWMHIQGFIPITCPTEPAIGTSDEMYGRYEAELKDYEDEFKKYVYHVKLLIDANYIEAINIKTISGENFIIKRIMMNGHDYLDSVRNNDVWTAVKKKLSSTTGSAALDVVKDVATKILLSKLGV